MPITRSVSKGHTLSVPELHGSKRKTPKGRQKAEPSSKRKKTAKTEPSALLPTEHASDSSVGQYSNANRLEIISSVGSRQPRLGDTVHHEYNHASHNQFDNSVFHGQLTFNNYTRAASETVADGAQSLKLSVPELKIRAIVTGEVMECLRSLNAYDCESNRDNLLLKRHANTCDWLFSDDSFRLWNESENGSVLWVSGGPGCGKSVLSSFLSKNLSSYREDCLVLYFFCDDKHEQLKNATAVLFNLLFQLLKQDPSVFKHFVPEYCIKKGETSWTFGALWRVFGRIAKDSTLRPMYVIIDALDECDETRIKLLEYLGQIIQNDSIGKHIKIVITSRPHIPLRTYLPKVTIVSLDATNLEHDIASFVGAEVQKLSRFPNDLRDEIQRVLISGANGMFLWVSLILADLRQSTTTTRRAIKQKLQSLPPDLPKVYEAILKQIKPEDQERAVNILQWVVYAMKPLSLKELAVAIAIKPEHASTSSLQDDIETDLRTVLQLIFGPLLKIDEASHVHLVHQSAKDFLSEINLSETNPIPRFAYRLDATESNIQLTSSCLHYLALDEFGREPITNIFVYILTMGQKDKFLSYAARGWWSHMKPLGSAAQQRPELWTAFKKVVKSKEKTTQAYQILSESNSNNIHSLYFAAHLGVVSFVEKLLEIDGTDINDLCDEGTALHAAARAGNMAVVRLLINRGANVNIQSTEGSVLSAAAIGGDEAVVSLLIDHIANVNALCDLEAALFTAAQFGHKAVVRLLIEHGADVNTTEHSGFRTPLFIAAFWGHEAVVCLLIDHGANIDVCCGVDGAALHSAAGSGHEAVVRLLADRGANIDICSDYQGTALHSAAGAGHEGVVRLLVDRGANLDISSTFKGTPLDWAIILQREAVVDILSTGGTDAVL